jgi:dTDP-4-dehydrorhamnose reductase
MDKPRILIVGARGFLGTHAAHAAMERFEVIRGDRSVTTPTRLAIDITDAASVECAFEAARPDAVLLAAAISDIDRCEAQPEQAFAVNVRGTEYIANACARMNARLLFLSTAAVFDGRKHGYREEDEINPLSIYGSTKAKAEKIAQDLVPDALIIRVSLILGFSKTSGTNSMLDSLYSQWIARKSVSLSPFEFRNPMHAASISQIMIDLLADPQTSGVYHAGASDSISRYELGRRLAARSGLPDNLVQPQTKAVPGRAPRGKDHFLLTERLQKVAGIEIQTCHQVIERCFV